MAAFNFFIDEPLTFRAIFSAVLFLMLVALVAGTMKVSLRYSTVEDDDVKRSARLIWWSSGGCLVVAAAVPVVVR